MSMACLLVRLQDFQLIRYTPRQSAQSDLADFWLALPGQPKIAFRFCFNPGYARARHYHLSLLAFLYQESL
jgi:hypothetical protein